MLKSEKHRERFSKPPDYRSSDIRSKSKIGVNFIAETSHLTFSPGRADAQKCLLPKEALQRIRTDCQICRPRRHAFGIPLGHRRKILAAIGAHEVTLAYAPLRHWHAPHG